ncbi:unnamed protein product, partial [marine sediment metagenome]
EIIGNSSLSFIHPDDKNIMREFREWSNKGIPTPKMYQLRYLKKDGGLVPVEISASHTMWHGKLAHLVTIRDITERKKAEQEKGDLAAKAEMSSRLASIGEMAAGIAHEINNPLTSVVGFSRLLMRKEIPEDIKADLEIITDGAKRTSEIVRRLLTFARQLKPERTELNINKLVLDTMALRNYEMVSGNIITTTDLAEHLPRLWADGGQLQQVFLNLIINAENAMIAAHGKGKLQVKSEMAG